MREAIQNAIEAGATRVRVEPCPLAMNDHATLPGGLKRLSIVDNGCGMNAKELLQYINKYNSSSKISGGHHDNFGINPIIVCINKSNNFSYGWSMDNPFT